ncbi:hypothetical protein GMOD_00006962 [Pyrenophora seminiperda CCB06]|uniref:Uncharacterized protein n=1 Tax=Pyrenophora seminiperda CCB06 TaxID=1302712 RepID=A0A3M7MBT4_9PLEO|nr:hypothetical protein GMOD_00006962 [Pyrenophora seminiperda CCB06]
MKSILHTHQAPPLLWNRARPLRNGCRNLPARATPALTSALNRRTMTRWHRCEKSYSSPRPQAYKPTSAAASQPNTKLLLHDIKPWFDSSVNVSSPTPTVLSQPTPITSFAANHVICLRQHASLRPARVPGPTAGTAVHLEKKMLELVIGARSMRARWLCPFASLLP